jgi:hypothetical protein
MKLLWFTVRHSHRTTLLKLWKIFIASGGKVLLKYGYYFNMTSNVILVLRVRCFEHACDSLSTYSTHYDFLGYRYIVNMKNLVKGVKKICLFLSFELLNLCWTFYEEIMSTFILLFLKIYIELYFDDHFLSSDRKETCFVCL